jgi:hypothetical protein
MPGERYASAEWRRTISAGWRLPHLEAKFWRLASESRHERERIPTEGIAKKSGAST